MTNMRPDSSGYPRWVYADPAIHGNVAPKIVNNAKDHVALGKGWSNTYIPHDYPRAMYNGALKRIVHNITEEKKLGADWSRMMPEDYVEPNSRTPEEIAEENAALKESLAALENADLKQKLAAAQAKLAASNR